MTPGWCQNVIAVARLREGERVLIGVHDALLAQGERLGASVAAAGARAEVVLRLPDSIDEAPKELRADRRSVELPSGPARRRASAGPRTTA